MSDNDPVMLYYQPHHSHEKMAHRINAELISAVRTNPLHRIRVAKSLDLGERTVITEGGQPLFQAAWMKIFGNCGKVIHLAADPTLMNIFSKLWNYSHIDRIAHLWAHRYVDGVIAVSPRLTTEARILRATPVKTIHPFAEHWKYENLSAISPDFGSNVIIGVGSKKPGNNFEILQEIANAMNQEVHFKVMGPDTDELQGEDVTGYGFVEKDRFLEIYREASGFILPAMEQAFPVSVLESLHAGLPPIITDNTGTQPFIRRIDPHLVTGRTPAALARSVDWYLSSTVEKREKLSKAARQMGELFEPTRMLDDFEVIYDQLLEEIE